MFMIIFCLRLSDLDNGRVLHQHLMPNISFASGGDNDTLDYIAYVAKGRFQKERRKRKYFALNGVLNMHLK